MLWSTALSAQACCAVKNCPLVNDCNLLARISDYYLPLSHMMPLIPPQSIAFIFGMGKLETLVYNLVKVARWSNSFGLLGTIHQRDRHRATSPSKCHANALHRVANKTCTKTSKITHTCLRETHKQNQCYKTQLKLPFTVTPSSQDMRAGTKFKSGGTNEWPTMRCRVPRHQKPQDRDVEGVQGINVRGLGEHCEHL